MISLLHSVQRYEAGEQTHRHAAYVLSRKILEGYGRAASSMGRASQSHRVKINGAQPR
jgi:hypothetical protein